MSDNKMSGADVLATIEDAAICLEIWGEFHEASDLRAAVATLIAERDAQAKRIAELLEALQSILACWESVCIANGWDPNHVIQATHAKAAIAKATKD